MPWDERTVNKMREEFVKRVLNHEKSKSALCREYGISRPTGDKWIKRYLAGESLEDRRRTPKTIHRTAKETEQLILGYRLDHQGLGAAKIKRTLENEGHSDLPCVKTVNNILKRNGLISKEASEAATPYLRFEQAEPNRMWQGDYKGSFLLRNGQRCYPLNVIDDSTRFDLCCKALHGETFEEMQPIMIGLFEEYGLPEIFLCDNGNPWGTQQTPGYTRFEVWMMEQGILVMHGRPLHPQTQGKVESFNRSLKNELLKFKTFADHAEADEEFRVYREFYNTKRPHKALDMETPITRYRKSERQYQSEIRPWEEYPEGCEIRTIKSTGYITWKSQGYFLSQAFGGKEVAVRESAEEGCIEILYRQFKIAKLNIEGGGYVWRRAYLLHNDPREGSERPKN